MNEDLKADTNLSHYRIVEKIGAGGMGEVYLAQDTRLDRKVAIKFLNEEFSRDADKLNRFIQEAKAVSALNHPNILTVHEIGETEDSNYIVTEFIEGKTLREHLSSDESISLSAILKIGVQVAEALAAAHQADIIHRDIKPENIMIRSDGYAKVLDFGLAKQAEKKKSERISLEGETKAFVQTNPGVVMGTVSYMSPEQARGKEVDARTDIWSLGVVLYEMLAGKIPFSGETINHTIVAILEKEPLLLENVPDELQRIVRKALTKEKEMRYQTVKDLLIDLKNLRRDLDIQGELERSVIPDRTALINQVQESKTLAFSAKSSAETNAEAADKKMQNATTSSSLEYAVTQAKNHKFVTSILGVVLLGAISAVVYFGFFANRSTKQIESIAVMPFVNESGNADVEYLSDGLTETLISSLSNLPNLNVKARSSVFRYKGKDANAATIGKELNVQAVLTGRVTQRGNDLSLYIELVDPATDKAIWSETYNRVMSNLASLQSEIARDVSQKLKTKLTGADEQRLAKNYTNNAEAYRFYLQGLYHWNKRTDKDRLKAIEYFNQAIAVDPNYALAYAGIADTFAFPFMGTFNNRDPQLREAALKALSLDENLPEAHTALGRILAVYDWDFTGAERKLRRGIELNPNDANAHLRLGQFLQVQGRMEEAFAAYRRALEIEPLSFTININYSALLMYAGRTDEAIELLKKMQELDENRLGTYFFLSVAYHIKGNHAESVAHRAKASEINGNYKEAAQWRESFAKGGWEGYLRTIIKNREADNLSFYFMAVCHAGLGEKEKAFEALQKSYEEREVPLILLKVDLRLAALRDDARFQDLLRRINLPQ